MIFYRVMDDLLTDSLYEELNDECGWQEVEADGEGEGGIRQRLWCSEFMIVSTLTLDLENINNRLNPAIIDSKKPS